MARRRTRITTSEITGVDEALEALGPEDLRDLIRQQLLCLDGENHTRLANAIVNRGARGGSGWAPAGPSEESVAAVVAFARASERDGYAEPSDVDEYLALGTAAFLGKEYEAAAWVFRALLVPISECEIDLGQDEMVTEVLGTDMGACTMQYVVSQYMLAEPDRRAQVVDAALGEMGELYTPLEAIHEMEQVSVEPLPGLDGFLPAWAGLLRNRAREEGADEWDTHEDGWRREVVQRLEGAAGLERMARSTGRSVDLRAWCRCLADAGDWKACLKAYEAAAKLATDREYWHGEFLDGAALAAQELGRRDLPARLERAWRATPTVLRLRRWLGTAGNRATLRKRTAQALEACPKKAARQGALLHVLVGDLEAAAKLVGKAPGLGWSSEEHPGHLVFPMLIRLLGGDMADHLPAHRGIAPLWSYADEMDRDEVEGDRPALAAPKVSELIDAAGVQGSGEGKARKAVLADLRKAAKRRVAGVADKKRRRHYGHAAQLVAACAAVEQTPETARWVAGVREEYRRFPALQREFESCLRAR